MNDFISTFSFYGVLRILIPGLYFFLCLNNIFIASNITFNLFQNETLNSIAVSIIVITLGLIIYAFDFPRMIRKMTSKLPSNQIKKKHPALAIEKIESQYFSFYYSSPEDIKERTKI
jgi:predicted membrane channel-forming protein YqfA (hemolysin III family)